MNTSLWDCLCGDVQECIITRQTRLCFQDCLDEYNKVGPHARKIKCLEKIKSIIDLYGDMIDDSEDNPFEDLYSSLYEAFFDHKEILMLNQCLFGFKRYESIEVLVADNCYTLSNLEQVLMHCKAFQGEN